MSIGLHIGITNGSRGMAAGEPLSAPVITGSPAISGSATVGQMLIATAASTSGNPVPVLTWQWQRNDGSWGDIAGATSASYTITNADVGHQLRVVQTETNSEGVDTATSGASGAAVYADRVLFNGHELEFDGKVIVHSGGDGTNTLSIAAGSGMAITQTETLVTLGAT